MYLKPETKSLIDCYFFSTVEYGDWFEYVLGWETLMKEKEYDIHLVCFEDLKEVTC